MTREEIRDLVLVELSNVAPDVDVSSVDEDAVLRDEYDLDSMDTLRLLEALHRRLAVDIPERDYARMRSISELLDYLEPRLA